jgi:hypothetical protein
VRVRSLVGLIPLLACENIEWEELDRLPASRNACSGFSTIGPRSRGRRAIWNV